MRISITLPSLHPDALNHTLDNIDSSGSGKHVFEVLVCAPFEVRCNLANGVVIWIKDEQQNGCVAAHAAAARAATGDFITAFADDHAYTRGWDEKAMENFERRERIWLNSFSIMGPFSLGLRQISDTPHVGTMFGVYYPYFPLMRRIDVKRVGGWYDASRYRRGFSDPDLGLRVWSAGGRCEWADEMTVVVRSSGAADWHDDMPKFLERWAPVYGAGWDLSHVRGWDIDVPVNVFGRDERTCYRPDLPFREGSWA